MDKHAKYSNTWHSGSGGNGPVRGLGGTYGDTPTGSRGCAIIPVIFVALVLLVVFLAAYFLSPTFANFINSFIM